MVFRGFVESFLVEKWFFGVLSRVFWLKNDFLGLCREFFGEKMIFQLFVDAWRPKKPFLSSLFRNDDPKKANGSLCTVSKTSRNLIGRFVTDWHLANDWSGLCTRATPHHNRFAPIIGARHRAIAQGCLNTSLERLKYHGRTLLPKNNCNAYLCPYSSKNQ